jgi:hypothetical protein
MSNLQSANSMLLKIIISTKNECVFIHDLRDPNLHILINT